MIVRTEAELRRAMQLRSESEHLKFKEAKTDYDFDKLTDYCCALANEGGGSIILGVTDKTPRRIVGSAAFANLDKAKKGLFDRLHIRVETAVIKTADGRVLAFIVPARPPGLPVHVARHYVRGRSSDRRYDGANGA
jgi:ATP-dependent DNA helicase RecG